MFAITFFHPDFFQKNNRAMNQKRQALVALLLLTAGALHLSAQNVVADYLQRAEKQFDLGAYNVAVITLEEILRQEPNNTSALAKKADCMVQLNRPFEALALYDRSLSLGNSNPEVKLKYGHALMQGGDYVGAKRWYQQYALTNPIVGQHFSAAADQAVKISTAPARFSVRSEGINTSGSEYGAAFFGDKVVFNSSRKDMPRSSKNGDAGANELYLATPTFPEGLLQSPTYFLSDAQNNLLVNEGPISFNKSATRAVFSANKWVEGSRQIAPKGMEMALFLADVNAEGKLLNIQPFPYNKEGYGVGFPFLSEDGNTLLFASNLPEGLGGWDLYVSNHDPLKGTWTSPRNLGGLVNTPGNEISPFLDENKLYFSSDWHQGLGGLDVFKAEFQNGYASNVSNLGIGVNSSRDDYGFIYQATKRKGYLTSNRSEGKGNEDIYQVTELSEQFAITVRDQNYLPLAEVEIDLSTCNGGMLRTDLAGTAQFLGGWNAGTCAVSIKKPGYSTVFLSVNASSDRNLAVTLVSLPQTTANAPIAKSAAQVSEALGIILDADTKDPILGAKITATPVPAGPKLDVLSNSFGQYTFQLEPNRSYTLSYTANGYTDQVLNFYSAGAGSQSTVSQVSLKKTSPSTARGENDSAVFAWTTPQKQAAAPAKTISAPAETKPTPNNLVDGYSVQLTAFVTGATDVELSQFEELKKHGNLYQIKEDQKNKLRLGVFSERATAELALQKARAIKKDAFLVEEKAINGDWVYQPAPKELELGPMIVSKSAAVEPVAAAPVLHAAASPVSYAVRVKSVESTKTLVLNDLIELSQLGNLYTQVENGWILVKLGPWTSLNEAERIQATLAAKGHGEAVVIPERTVPAVKSSSSPTSVSPLASNPVKGAPVTTPRGGLPDLLGPVPNAPEVLAPVTLAAAEEEEVDFMVRICVLSGDLSAFDVKKAEQAGGQVDARMSKTGNYVMLLTGFDGKASAQKAAQKIIELGFKEAYLVKEKQGDGILRRVVD
jgi:hypothetical protein